MNLLNRLWFVYCVFDPNGEYADDICISRCHDDYLGYSQVIGIFKRKREAARFTGKVRREMEQREQREK